MKLNGSLFQINTSRGGVPKLPVQQARVTTLGLAGDIQKDKRYHGGPERAISLFSIDIIQKLKQEGHPIAAGSTGENLTLAIDDYASLKPGIKLKIGIEVILEITSYAAPCKTIQHSFLQNEFTRISQKVFPHESRLYARVLQEGNIQAGDAVCIL